MATSGERYLKKLLHRQDGATARAHSAKLLMCKAWKGPRGLKREGIGFVGGSLTLAEGMQLWARRHIGKVAQRVEEALETSWMLRVDKVPNPIGVGHTLLYLVAPYFQRR